MAIALPSAIVTAPSGNLAGTCFKNTRRGAVIARAQRHRATPTQRTLKQRSALQICHDQWLTETDEMRGAWRQYALTHPVKDRYGRNQNLSAYQWYCKVGLPWARALGYAIHIPYTQDPDAILEYITLYAEYETEMTITRWPFPGTIDAVVFHGYRSLTQHALAHIPRWTYITLYQTWAAETYDLRTEFAAILGEPYPDEWFAVRVDQFADYLPIGRPLIASAFMST